MKYRFSDLVDIEAFKQLMTSFYEVTGIPHGLVDADSNILSGFSWQDVCANFHRSHPGMGTDGKEEEVSLDSHKNALADYACVNGLMNYAMPIHIEGEHLATLYLGQLLHEPPDLEFFRKQAHTLGFDEQDYLAAVQRLPVVPKARADAIMAYYVQLANMLAATGLEHLRRCEAEEEAQALSADLECRIDERTAELGKKNDLLAFEMARLRLLEDDLRISHERLQALMDLSPIGIGWSSDDGKIEYINNRFVEMFGYDRDDLVTVEDWYAHVYPDPTYRHEVIYKWVAEVNEARSNKTKPPVLEVEATCKNGKVRHVMVAVSWVGNLRLACFTDISEQWKIEHRERTHNRMLELVAKGVPLPQILNAIVTGLEVDNPEMICSILLLDESGKHLLSGAAPSLPKAFNDAVSGVEIGVGQGSCGTAAYLGERVIVEDIFSHPYWAKYQTLADIAGVKSAWSEPVFSSHGVVLGTFAIYHRKPSVPQKDDIGLIQYAANLVGIAVEHDKVQRELERQAHIDFLTGLANRRYFLEQAEQEQSRALRYGNAFSILMLDIDHFKKVNDTYGHKVGDLTLQKLSDVCHSTLREVDVIGRLGGEEFAVMLPETDASKAMEVAERLRLAIEQAEFTVDSRVIHFTVSIGVATLEKATPDFDTLLKQADEALYEAKRTGRNRTCTSLPS